MENVVGKHAGILIQQEKKLIEVEKLNVMAIIGDDDIAFERER